MSTGTCWPDDRGSSRLRDIVCFHFQSDPMALKRFYRERSALVDLFDRNAIEYICLPWMRQVDPELAAELEQLFRVSLSAAQREKARWGSCRYLSQYQ